MQDATVVEVTRISPDVRQYTVESVTVIILSITVIVAIHIAVLVLSKRMENAKSDRLNPD